MAKESVAQNGNKRKVRALPLVPLRGMVVYPGLTFSFDIGRSGSLKALEEAMSQGRQLFLVAQINLEDEWPEIDNIYPVGTIATVRQILEMPDNMYKVLVEGKVRARLVRVLHDDPFYQVEVAEQSGKRQTAADRAYTEAAIRTLVRSFEQFAVNSGRIPPDTVMMITSSENHVQIVDAIANQLQLKLTEKQTILEIPVLRDRIDHLLVLLQREIQLSELEQQIESKVQQSLEKNQREYYLREQMRTIQDELGDREDQAGDETMLREKLAASLMPEEYKEKLSKEIDRFARTPAHFPDSAVQRNWLEMLVELPFGRIDKERLDLRKARQILNRDHYGLKKVKERILEYLAVRKLQLEEDAEVGVKGPILCFVGPPGVGKTSIARSIAEALGRKYIRMSLGGIRDEAEIRGHRRTYIGAMPGRIMQGIRTVNTDNPLFLLDEIDKLGSDFRGDPSSALLEVLDPEQNNSFRDHYLELPYDLSKVLFITTANMAEMIPEPLLDRMELIELTGYTEEEKQQIARRHLIPKQLTRHALKKEQLRFTPSAIARLISWYTREAGVRQLEREIAHVCRRVAIKLTEDDLDSFTVRPDNLEDLIGKRHYSFDMAEKKDRIGVATGLAWTWAGGDTLVIEVNSMPGDGKLELTGQLGDVMKESAKAALTYIRSRAQALGISDDMTARRDIHIHVPAGATPKDGPSAGITLATALASALSGRAVHHDLAMTGEITLRGRVLPIGGLKEKAVAAKRAGINRILVPEENRRDLEDIPETVKKKLEIKFVETMDQVLAEALLPPKDEQ